MRRSFVNVPREAAVTNAVLDREMESSPALADVITYMVQQMISSTLESK